MYVLALFLYSSVSFLTEPATIILQPAPATDSAIEAAADNTASSVDTRAALLFHNEAVIMAEQMAVRSQTQYKQEYLSTLYTADTLYGVQVYRPEAGFVLAVPSA